MSEREQAEDRAFNILTSADVWDSIQHKGVTWSASPGPPRQFYTQLSAQWWPLDPWSEKREPSIIVGAGLMTPDRPGYLDEVRRLAFAIDKTLRRAVEAQGEKYGV